MELLVSISIVAVLTAVAVVSFGGLNKKARDQRRISDIERIRVALESYRQVNNYYPSSVGKTANLTGYLDRWPADPKTGLATAYAYTAANPYYICVPVELTTSVSSDGSSCGTTPSGYAGYYKAVQP